MFDFADVTENGTLCWNIQYSTKNFILRIHFSVVLFVASVQQCPAKQLENPCCWFYLAFLPITGPKSAAFLWPIIILFPKPWLSSWLSSPNAVGDGVSFKALEWGLYEYTELNVSWFTESWMLNCWPVDFWLCHGSSWVQILPKRNVESTGTGIWPRRIHLARMAPDHETINVTALFDSYLRHDWHLKSFFDVLWHFGEV